MDNPLINYGTDITQQAKEGKLDVVIGRDDEVLRASQILSRRKKNNLLLIGNPGAGKTVLLNLLAQRIVSKEISFTLHDKQIFSLDIGSVMAGTQYRGQMEERLVNIIKYLNENKNIILFIDEIHIIMETGSSSSSSLNIANILKPYLSNGDLQIIGATTHEEAKKYFEKDGAMNRRFHKLIVEDPSPEQTVKILEMSKDSYEKFHGVSYPSDVIEKIPFLAHRYLTDRHLPDSAFDILDEAGARASMESSEPPSSIIKIETDIQTLKAKTYELVREENWKEIASLRKKIKSCENKLKNSISKWEEDKDNNRKIITESDIIKVISSISNIPLDKLSYNSNEKINNLIEKFDAIVGQNEVKDKIINALKRNVIGLQSPIKPIFSALLLGATGTGKTEIAKILAETWFNGSMLRLDMSEFMEKISSSALLGAAPGYVGYEKGGRFEQIRRNPYSLVLFDEIEKANKDVLNTLLQILDNGEITDGQGRIINFRNCIILMTSNLGARESAVKSVGFGSKPNILSDKSIDSAKKFFSPEIWNRIDNVIVFEQLTKEYIIKILDNEIRNLRKLIKSNNNIDFQLTEQVKEFLISKGYSEEYGARHLKRTIQKEITDVLTEYILSNINIGITLNLDVVDDKIIIS